MQLTYAAARDTILKTTELGYTIASQDQLWIVFTFDADSEDEFRYSRLYFTRRGVMSYDLFDEELLFTSRREAEDFARGQRLARMGRYKAWVAKGNAKFELPDVYVMNLGDDARYEDLQLGGNKHTRRTPKFRGSTAAWHAMNEMASRWAERYKNCLVCGEEGCNGGCID